MFKDIYNFIIYTCISLLLCSCGATDNSPIPGRDKQGQSMLTGAALGATSGAITGAQFASSTGPGAFIGAGFGAIWGTIQGLGIDALEEEDLRLMDQLYERQDDVWAEYAFLSHLERKKELFPNRDIFPSADFFRADDVILSEEGKILTKFLAKKYSNQSSFSRITITSYVQSKDIESQYAKFLNKRRAEAIALQFSRSGFEPRRIHLETIILGSPLVDDPYDYADAYSQALEFALVDR